MAPRSSLALPENYEEVLTRLKERVQATRVRALLAANAELIRLYLDIGQSLATSGERWGDKVVARLARDLRRAFPDMRGFSRTNLYYMRQVWLAWAGAPEIVQQLVGQIPWGQHIVLVSKLQDPSVRTFYLQKIIEEGWSRAVLTLQIERQLHRRLGQAVSNFQVTLPPSDSDLAEQVFKDPYIFDFLGTADVRREREVENALLAHIQDFLLELGSGFAFVGRQVHIEVQGRDFYIDLLFYHLRLRRFIIIELKAVPFEPSFTGQLNFYLSAVDDQMKHPTDEPSIGLLLVKEPDKDQVFVEYALRGLNRPIGVASWEIELVRSLPDELRGSLPTVEELEQELVGEE
jgi:predicted nuclease of restriction endonuclease-like (RecB) superfamily